MARPAVELLLVPAATNAIAWAAYRLDKLAARRDWRRISEATLLVLALLGGLGALAGMYAHRLRHKTAKPLFVGTVALAVLLQVAALAAFAYLWVSSPRR